MMSFLVNLVLYVIGTGALLATYLAFSPVTRDLVMFLSRDDQITIFRHRRFLWALGAACFAVLVLRVILGLGGAGGTHGVLTRGADLLGTAGASWLWVAGFTIALLGLLFWATYVPVVMAPPRNHKLLGIEEADKLLAPGSIVLGLVMNDVVRAYPRDLIARPHWFNDHIDGKPLMVSYCILCNSGQAFVPEVNGRRLNLRNLTAYDNNTVYHDSEAGNFIQQLEGRVIRGPDMGATLISYPVIMASWQEWKRLHPNTKVFYAPPANLRDRVVDKMLQTMIPVGKLARRSKPWHLMHGPIDDRLPAMAFVFGVEIGGDACAYPLSALGERSVINDTVGGEPLVVLYDPARNIGQIFVRRLQDRVLTFSVLFDRVLGTIARDEQTGSFWDITGQARRGPLTGYRLATLPHYNQLFWFSWAAFKRGTRINFGDNRTAPAAHSGKSIAAGAASADRIGPSRHAL